MFMNLFYVMVIFSDVKDYPYQQAVHALILLSF